MTIDTKELRRLASRYIGVSVSSPVSPKGLIEILDRLEAAEKERELLRARNDFADEAIGYITQERDALRAALRHEADCVEACKSELAQLRKDADKFGDGIGWIQRALQAEARIEAMERQEPVAWRTFDGEGGYDYRSYEDNENYKLGWDARNPNHIGWVEPLYALPGAQPAQSVPDGWQLVPKQATQEMVRACASAARAYMQEFGGNSPHVMWSAMLAAAPEAKP